MFDECEIRVEINGELVASAEIPFEEGKSTTLRGKSDLQASEKAAICRGLAHLANFMGCDGAEL